MKLVLLLCILTATVVGCSTPSPRPATAQSPPLRIMSFNIRCATADDGANSWIYRRDLLMQTIMDFDPDLLGAQEVVASQADELRQALTGWGFIGVGRDDGTRAGEFSPIFFRSDRFELVDHGHFWLSESPAVPGSKSWDSALTRIATWAKLRDRHDRNRELFVLNTHWDHAGPIARLESAKLIRQRMVQLAGSNSNILIGDLNCTEDDEPYSVLCGSGGPASLLDSYRTVHPQREPDEATFHAFKGTRAGSRIDFILHSPQMIAVEARIDRTNASGQWSSDHFPVTAVLQGRSELTR